MALHVFSTLCLFFLSSLVRTAPAFAPPPEEVGICASVVQPHGYRCHEFQVTTEDGYILSVQRIPEGRKGGLRGPRQAVLLQHGVLMDGMTWLLNSPEQSLAFVLADNGFDVWIANIRGTRSSLGHVSLRSTDSAYWAWSWDELAAYDLPAMIDLVSKQTGQKIHYVGHSLILSNLLGMAEFNPKGVAVSNLLSTLCHHPGVNCYNLLTAFTGNNCCLNVSTVELFLKYEPQPTSTKNMVHLAQTFRDGILTKYNYGVENIERYGQWTPPIYNLSNIPKSLPLYLSYGGRDYLSDVQDVGHLLDDLKFHDADKLAVHYVQNYAHADFVMGVSAKQMVYDSMITFFRHQE